MSATNTSKVAVVTGASSGIGRVSAIALCRAGWKLVLSARREAELQETARLCAEAAGISDNYKQVATISVGDVTKEQDVKRLFEEGVQAFGRIDLLFNNAGISGQSAPIEEVPLDVFQAVLSTNLTAAFLCTQQAIKQFKSQSPRGGRIINNGSLAAYMPRPNSAPYAISKHAILGLTRSTSLEGRSFGITCTQIDVGNAMTEMASSHALTGALQPDGSMRKEAAIDAQHVASSVVHIASLPLDVTVLVMNVMATEMPYVGRG